MNRQEKFNAKHEQDKYIIIGVIAVLFILGGAMAWLTTKMPSSPNGLTATSTATSTGVTSTSTGALSGTLADDQKTAFAKYLAANKITMYGAAWCPHCTDQKNAFGSAWQYVPYVECPENAKLCLAKGIEGYPTWQKPDGSSLSGFRELPELAAWAGFNF